MKRKYERPKAKRIIQFNGSLWRIYRDSYMAYLKMKPGWKFLRRVTRVAT